MESLNDVIKHLREEIDTVIAAFENEYYMDICYDLDINVKMRGNDYIS